MPITFSFLNIESNPLKRREKSNENRMEKDNEATDNQIIIRMYLNLGHIPGPLT